MNGQTLMTLQSNCLKNFLILILNGLVFLTCIKKITELDNFIGDPNKSNEKILEAIQQSWIDEFI